MNVNESVRRRAGVVEAAAPYGRRDQLLVVSVAVFFGADLCFVFAWWVLAFAWVLLLVDVGVTFVVTVVVALAPGTFVVVVLVVLALGAARAGAAIKAAAATDAIRFFIASSCLRQESAG